MKIFMCKFLISFLLIAFFVQSVQAESFVSLSPALTETIYAIGAQDQLKAVSTACTYPNETKKKEKIGNSYFINAEKIIKIKPDYILALDSSEFATNKFKRFGIKPLCFKNPDIASIYSNIIAIGRLTGKEKEAERIVEFSKQKISQANKNSRKKILYLVQTSPMISVGKKSFINDIISKSGNVSVTANIDSFYPTISEEYAITQKPDIIVLSLFSDATRIKKLFPNAKIVVMSDADTDIINRPGPRVYKSVEFFANL